MWYVEGRGGGRMRREEASERLEGRRVIWVRRVGFGRCVGVFGKLEVGGVGFWRLELSLSSS